MRRLWAVLVGVAAAGQLGCCSTQTTAAGFERRCVPMPGVNRSLATSPPPTRVSPPVAGGLAVRWDEDLSIYTVADHPCLFLRLATLYRIDAGRWYAAGSLEGPWSRIDASALPRGFDSQLAASRCAEAADGPSP